ncbi:MAG: GntR family transcriptional regulator, partial [Anaerolineales bacterium]
MADPSPDGSRPPHPSEPKVVHRLRHLILSRQLRPGERLVQSDLAEQLGVSRTPIREALHRLASDGLVTIAPHKGATVAKFLLSDLEEIYSVRIALEGYAAYLAAQHITDEDLAKLDRLLEEMEQAFQASDRARLLEVNRKFDTGIYAASRQPRLCELIVKHIELADLYRRLYFSLDNLAAHTVA